MEGSVMFLWVLIATAFGQEHAALFVGNSYTAFNGPDNLAGSYKHLLEEGMPTWGPLEIHSHAPGGVSFEGHLQAAQASGPLHDYLTGASGVSQWDVVVLQDQSQVPSFPQDQPTYAASRAAVVSLAEMVVAMGGTPHLFQTWGRRNGDAQNEWLNPDFSTMQQNLWRATRAMRGPLKARAWRYRSSRWGRGGSGYTMTWWQPGWTPLWETPCSLDSTPTMAVTPARLGPILPPALPMPRFQGKARWGWSGLTQA